MIIIVLKFGWSINSSNIASLLSLMLPYDLLWHSQCVSVLEFLTRSLLKDFQKQDLLCI